MTKSTAQQIVDATLATVQEKGIAGATSREIARRGGFNQALIFYHHGSLEAVLLAALEQTSRARLARYRDVLDGATGADELVARMVDLYEEDKASGHMRVVAQLIAGTVDKPELAQRVLAQMEPWIQFADETLKRVLPKGLPARELAYAAVTFYLGVNLMTHLDPDAARTDALFAEVRELAPLLGVIASAGSRGRPSTSRGRASAT